MQTFEEILEDGADNCGWNQDTKYQLLLSFLEDHCTDKLIKFNEVIDGIVEEETSS
jgi:hypothetical protein